MEKGSQCLGLKIAELMMMVMMVMMVMMMVITMVMMIKKQWDVDVVWAWTWLIDGHRNLTLLSGRHSDSGLG